MTGQDGAYLAEFLLGKGYEVHGIKRRASLFNTDRVDHLYQDPHESDRRFILHYGDLTDATNLIRVVQLVQPDEIYNLAAQSHVGASFETAEYTANADAIGTLRLLEAIRILGLERVTRFYQASTSELFGKVREIPQNENTPFYPRSTASGGWNGSRATSGTEQSAALNANTTFELSCTGPAGTANASVTVTLAPTSSGGSGGGGGAIGYILLLVVLALVALREQFELAARRTVGASQ